jgi:hypothetical protein
MKKWLLRETIEQGVEDLRGIPEAAASAPVRDGWSRKEELGHLIDSATNNHVRFVRAALEREFSDPGYAQNEWVAIHGYRDQSWSALIDLWCSYNTLLANLIERIAEDRLASVCVIGDDPPVSLELLIEDYVAHVRHHLDRICGRSTAKWGARM